MKRALQKHGLVLSWFVFSSLAFCWLLLGPYGDHFNHLGVRVALFTLLVAGSLLFLRKTRPELNSWTALFAILVGYAVIYEIVAFLPGINDYPFSQTWSEGSAHYFASLYFSEELYGFSADLPLINPTRHMLLAIPFLLPDLPIWVHRLWEVILWVSITWAGVYLLLRRLGIENRLMYWVFSGWAFLFLLQGPVYYFLLISIIPILWGFDRNKFYRNLALVLIGSAWAGASRVNWIPVPALLAATLYFLEMRVPERDWKRYLARPFIWLATGVSVGLLSWRGYAMWSGHPPGDFGIYFTSNLLWYRLFPNATFQGGVLPISLVASLPLAVIILIQYYRSGFKFHLVRILGLVTILFVLFTGGLVVSTKIGGGNNIHNLDAYLVILLVSASYMFFGRAAPDFYSKERDSLNKWVNPLVILAVMVPVLFTLQGGKPISLPKTSRTENALLTIQEYANQIASGGGKVLFMAERQLLTYGEIKDVPVLPEYERMNLMEMVMGGNTGYLEKFQRRIRNREYDLIISEPLTTEYKGRSSPFGDENDVYVEQVSQPVLCYYEPVKTLSSFPVQLLVPRSPGDTCTNSTNFEFN